MSFNQNQVRKLSAKLRPQHVRTREADGLTLSYLEGWHVVAEANRIFGFEGWDRETISSECVWSKQVNGRYCAAYVTRIRIRVRAGEAVIVREGSGAGESNAASPGQAHEFAAKAAETDATKRALMTFGNAFGLSLYGGSVEPRVKASPLTAAGLEPQDTAASEPHSATDPAAVQPSQLVAEEVETASTTTDEPSRTACSATLPVTLPAPDWPQVSPLGEAQPLNRERQERIDKTELTLGEPKRLRSSAHLAFVASRPCLICGRNRAHAHHLKFAQPTALGRKVSDEFTVPLCSFHHHELHQHGDERVWWETHRIDALAVAEELWSERTCVLSGIDPP